MRRIFSVAATCFLIALFPFSSGAVDLAVKYPATLDWTEKTVGRTWECAKEDVWRLKSFRYAFGDKLLIELGPSRAVFGHHQKNVVWAVVLPEEPGNITKAPTGRGERVESVWLRFNPALVSEIFPSATVAGRGDEANVLQARRLAKFKTTASWQMNNLPVIPWKKSIVLDLETSEGNRRFFSIDTEASKVEYVDAFRTRVFPKPESMDRETALDAFDWIWKAFDREYAMFVVKPKVDWQKERETYRPKAAAAATNYELAAVLAEMLSHLEDLHIFVKVGNEFVPGYTRERPLNASWKAARHLMGDFTDTGKDLAWGRTQDGLGYVNIYNLSNQSLPQVFDEALGQLADTKGLVVDLRYNGGGDEPMGRRLAGRFLDKARVYSMSRYRNGPKHADLGPKYERTVQPRGPWRYDGPVVALQGQKTMSSAESFALMLAQCPQVTTMGDRTAGSSANPRRVSVWGGITVNLPRWLDLDEKGKPIDAVGVPPDVPVAADADSFTDTSDPVLKAALDFLRNKTTSE